jgi:hypothetical protein
LSVRQLITEHEFCRKDESGQVSFETFFQSASLLALAAAVLVSVWQAREATKMAKLSLEQTELTRAQLDAAFRPVIEVVGGEHGTQSAMLTVKNVGTSPALSLCAVFRNGWRENLGTLAPDAARRFRFDYSFNMPPPPPVGPPTRPSQMKKEFQQAPLRLEYISVSGAMWWTNVDFRLGAEPPIEFQHDHGKEGDRGSKSLGSSPL